MFSLNALFLVIASIANTGHNVSPVAKRPNIGASQSPIPGMVCGPVVTMSNGKGVQYCEVAKRD